MKNISEIPTKFRMKSLLWLNVAYSKQYITCLEARVSRIEAPKK